MNGEHWDLNFFLIWSQDQ